MGSIRNTIIILLFCNISIYAQQARFTFSGIIEFEKSTNMYAIMKKRINKDNENYMQPVYEQYRKRNPQFMLLKSTLVFSGQQSLFTPIAPEANAEMGFFNGNPMADQHNIIYTDYRTDSFTAQKKVYEETFLVRDKRRKINWKITTETREIAGYPCRRANAIILDSVYVVAFYTDQIPLSGGPESFSGLPGMILGVALPHENITWFAKSVKDQPVNTATIKAPTKGKPMDRATLTSTLQSIMKSWGDYTSTALKAFSL